MSSHLDIKNSVKKQFLFLAGSSHRFSFSFIKIVKIIWPFPSGCSHNFGKAYNSLIDSSIHFNLQVGGPPF